MTRPQTFPILFLFFCILAGFYTAGSLNLPLGTFTHPGAGFYPLMVGIVFLLLGVGLFIQSYSSGRNKKREGEEFPRGRDLERVVYMGLILIFFALIFKPLGYGLSSSILLVAVLYVLGMQNWLKIVVISILTAILSYYLFNYMLGVPLPKGTLFS